MTGSTQSSSRPEGSRIPGRPLWLGINLALLLALAGLGYHLWARLPPVEERVGPPTQAEVSPDQARKAAELARENDELARRIAEARQQLAQAACPPGTARP